MTNKDVGGVSYVLAKGMIGGFASVVGTFISQPFDTVKTIKVQDNCKYDRAIVNIYKNYGVKRFWQGLDAAMLRSLLGSGVFFASLNYLKILGKPYTTDSNAPAMNFITAVLARGLSDVVSAPLFTIKTYLEYSPRAISEFIQDDQQRCGGCFLCISKRNDWWFC
eukprot:TRINITY_DN748_c0_g1_i3.p1 TRINITY_DN748_c0_g1~~TRINITY_DN748_c0_g1_i3.p1  ORF type:complete len:180 (-),score=15.10 TRINITY_DN748_c0_g1_i3:178-672(-)